MKYNFSNEYGKSHRHSKCEKLYFSVQMDGNGAPRAVGCTWLGRARTHPPREYGGARALTLYRGWHLSLKPGTRWA